MEREVYRGKVIWFNAGQGFGFLEWSKNGSKQKDMFVHFSDIQMDGFRILKKDQEVEFELGKNNKGVDKAINLVVIK